MESSSEAPESAQTLSVEDLTMIATFGAEAISVCACKRCGQRIAEVTLAGQWVGTCVMCMEDVSRSLARAKRPVAEVIRMTHPPHLEKVARLVLRWGTNG